jgi:hypothetical protein
MANEFIARKGLIVSGSTQLTGSLNVSRGITGSLFGTSSWASNVISASFATTASYALSAIVTVPAGTVSSSLQFNSLTLPFTGSFTGSFTGDGTGLTGVTATAFPFNGAAVITGSLLISGSGLRVTGSADVLGNFTATTKSFKIDHQRLLGKKLIYGVVEAPEHSVMVRGKLSGINTIILPDEWEWLIDHDSITVQLTSIGRHQELFIQEILSDRIIIGSDMNINCFYIVQATRKDVAPLTTVE